MSSPPPTTVWLLDSTLVVAVRRDSRKGVHMAAEPVPDGTFDIGPAVGLQAVDQDKAAGVLATVHERLGGARRVAVVVPTAWVRMHHLEFEQLPRRTAEMRDVLRWRLKKLLPVNVNDLRLAIQPQPGGPDDQRAVVCVSALERAIAALESAFSAVNLAPGFIGPRALALSEGDHDDAARPRLIVQEEPGFLSVVLVVSGSIRFVRTKPVAAGASEAGALEREMRLAENFIRANLDVGGEIAVEIYADQDDHAALLEGWWADRPGFAVKATWHPPEITPPGLADRIGAVRLAPAWWLTGGRRA